MLSNHRHGFREPKSPTRPLRGCLRNAGAPEEAKGGDAGTARLVTLPELGESIRAERSSSDRGEVKFVRLPRRLPPPGQLVLFGELVDSVGTPVGCSPKATPTRAGRPVNTPAPRDSRLNNRRLPRGSGRAKCALGGQDPGVRSPARQGPCAPEGAIGGGTCDTAVGAAR